MSKLLDIQPKLICDHELRKCKGTDLTECVKCFSLMDDDEV